MTSENQDKQLASLLAFLLLASFSAVAMYLRFPVLVDDNYITYRVATNWALGHGPVYTAGARATTFTAQPRRR